MQMTWIGLQQSGIAARRFGEVAGMMEAHRIRKKGIIHA